jgi:hypothetical protein
LHVLMVSYVAPPYTAARCTRMANVGKALLAQGHEVTVLSCDLGGTDRLSLAKLDGARFIRTPPGPLELWRRRRGLRAMRRAEGGVHKRGSEQTPGWLRRTAHYLLVPEGQIEWAYFAVRRPYRPASAPHLVLSFCPFFSSAVAGDRMARKLGCPHVIDYGDPWSYRYDPQLPAWRRRLDFAFERAVLRRARGAVVNAEPQRKALRGHFPGVSVALFTNGFDSADYPLADPPTGEEFRHLGHLYDIRLSLAPLGEGLGEGRHFERLISYGRRSRVALPPWIEERGVVDFEDSLALMQTAAALFMPGNRGGMQIPSKAFSYMGAKRPFLALVEDTADPVAELLGGVEQAVLALPEKTSVSNALARLSEMRNESFAAPPAFDWRHIGRDYVRLLEEWTGS